MYKLAKMTALGSLALLLSINAQAVIIDDSETEQAAIESTGSAVSSQVAADPGTSILGGYRDMYVERTFTANPGGSITAGVVQALPLSDDVLYVDIDAATTGFLAVTYDGANEVGNTYTNVDVDGLGGVDLSAFQGLAISTWFVDIDTPFSITFWTDQDDAIDDNYIATTVDFLATAINGVDPLTAPEDRIIPFFAYEALGANFADVGAIQAIFNMDNSLSNARVSADLVIGLVEAVPEPSVLAMFGAGMLMIGGFSGYRRRNKKA